MPWINNLKLMPKLLLTFGVLLLVMLLQGIVAYRGLHSLNNVTTELAGSRMESIRLAGEMRGMLGEYRNAAYQQLIRASDDVKSDARKQAVDLRTSMDKSIRTIRSWSTTHNRRSCSTPSPRNGRMRWRPMTASPRCWNLTCQTMPSIPSSAKPVPSTARLHRRWKR